MSMGPYRVELRLARNSRRLPMILRTDIVVQESSIPVYDGSFDVTPLPGAEVVLETAGFRMEDDVTVREIPYFETTNDSGGYTVIIG